MKCYVCDEQGRATDAVAICRACFAALCRRHLEESVRAAGPGGTSITCRHRPGFGATVPGA